MWENQVGRSEGFWQHFYPRLRSTFHESLNDVAMETFRREVNLVEPGPIRVYADEVTYNLHITIRFELELALVSGDLRASDLPGAWNELYERHLGVRPASDSEGCLQDIHWADGLIGYFPTYTLGNVYAAQLFATADREIGPLEESFAAGEFSQLREWLREKIHRHGKRYRATELIERTTGKALDPSALIANLKHRYAAA